MATKRAGRKTKKPSSQGKPRPTDEEIGQRAYEIYLARGDGHGRDVEDWLQAERELNNHPATRA